MKQLLPFLLLTLSLFSFNNIRAQFVVNVITVDCSSPAACDGYAMIDSSNTINFNAVSWYMNGTLLQNGGNAIYNLCPGSYSVNAMGGGMVLTSPFTIGTNTPNPCANFGVNLTSTPTRRELFYCPLKPSCTFPQYIKYLLSLDLILQHFSNIQATARFYPF